MQSMTGFTKLRGQARLAAAFGWFAALGAVIFVATLLVPRSVLLLVGWIYAIAAGSLVVCRWRQFRPHCFAIALPLLSLAVVGLRVPHHTNGGWLPIVLYVMLGCSGVVLGASSARLTIGWVAWIGVVSFAAFGVHTVTALPFLFAFLGLLSLGIAKLSSAEANKTRESCALLALSIGFTVTWLGVVWNERPYLDDPASLLAWTSAFPDEAPYRTMRVTGFPIQRIEGGPGAQDYLPWKKGLWCLLANFGICSAIAFAFIPTRYQSHRQFTMLLIAAIAGVAGWWRLVVWDCG